MLHVISCVRFLSIFRFILCLFFSFTGISIQQTEPQPEFLAPLDNFTVTQGRDVSFTCVVNDLGHYRVSDINLHNILFAISFFPSLSRFSFSLLSHSFVFHIGWESVPSTVISFVLNEMQWKHSTSLTAIAINYRISHSLRSKRQFELLDLRRILK